MRIETKFQFEINEETRKPKPREKKNEKAISQFYPKNF